MEQQTIHGSSPEVRALKINLPELTGILTTTVGPVWLANQLFGLNFVSSTKRDNILSAHGMGDYDKVSKLVSIVCEQVDEDYNRYNCFIQILQREPCLDGITEKLESSLQGTQITENLF